jgi:hypothetical protein
MPTPISLQQYRLGTVPRRCPPGRGLEMFMNSWHSRGRYSVLFRAPRTMLHAGLSRTAHIYTIRTLVRMQIGLLDDLFVSGM